MSTIFKFNFDFTSASQNDILKYLQTNSYKLLGFRGVSGPSQVNSGIPAWFAQPYGEVFGNVEFDMEESFKVYVSSQANTTTNVLDSSHAVSGIVPLGTAVTFSENGTFSTSPNAPAGTITVKNNRPAGTPNITIGLMAKINGVYAPFCAYISTPQGSVSIRPNNKLVIFAAQTNMVSGSVISNAVAPGCAFKFDASHIQYQLEMIPSTYGITSVPGGLPVTETSSGDDLNLLLNTPS